MVRLGSLAASHFLMPQFRPDPTSQQESVSERWFNSQDHSLLLWT